MTTKDSNALSLKDRLSRLSYAQTTKMLGPKGEKLIQQGGRYEIDLDQQIMLTDDIFHLFLDDAEVGISLSTKHKQRLKWQCDQCSTVCIHVGAAFSLILEEKTMLGLAEAPKEYEIQESLSDVALIARAIEERQERADKEKMQLKSNDADQLWTDYVITSKGSGKSYKLALRGWEYGDSFCSCPDFRKNTLGTCKHILHALKKMKKRFPARIRNTPYQQQQIAVHLLYHKELELRLLLPEELDTKVRTVVKPISNKAITNPKILLQRISQLQRLGQDVLIYPDAEEYIQRQLLQTRINKTVTAIRNDPQNHPLRTTLLKTELLPYQLDGIAFAAGTGRSILADDMGLGKTIQGIGTAELLAREINIDKVLIICPASLKSQWQNEILRFCDRVPQLVTGTAEQRHQQYGNDPFFTICNYEQVMRDLIAIEQTQWDLIILDEAQRIKNWQTRTSRVMKALKSPFALVLTGTPLENRLDDLFSVVEFIDDRHLGPAFRFYNRHKMMDERGKVLGYKNLSDLRETLKPVLLRRTRAGVMQDLPPRSTEIIRIAPTEEQLEIHDSQSRVINSIVHKKYISEMDLLRLQKALLLCRMVANSTFLIDKQAPGYSTKLAEIERLLDQLFQEQGRKIVLFSEWTTMLTLIESLLAERGLNYVRLDGSVPQKKRQALVHEFQHNENCQLFITTNAGSTGLNLQAADTVINVDLPWNPALLEQRIARAHRMGQKKKVQVFILITEQTIEENLLATLSAKHELALAVLDPDSDLDQVDLVSGMEELKRRLEVLLGAKPEAPVNESEKRRVQQQVDKTKVAEAGGQLLTAAFGFLQQMIPEQQETEASKQVTSLIKKQFAECMGKDDKGQLSLTVSLPNADALDNLARSLAGLIVANQSIGDKGLS
ncbi:MAG: DEAD/DEAH box helicase [Proteobacteria bacterium]|nr:DEAD/DEAH box helicase [Pseudomonadota bacterium]